MIFFGATQFIPKCVLNRKAMHGLNKLKVVCHFRQSIIISCPISDFTDFASKSISGRPPNRDIAENLRMRQKRVSGDKQMMNSRVELFDKKMNLMHRAYNLNAGQSHN